MVVVILCIASALSGLMIVGPLTGYAWSGLLLRRTLRDRASLLKFWSEYFRDSRGVMGALLTENPRWSKPEYPYCRGVIRAEYFTFAQMGRFALVSFLFLGVLWVWLSVRYNSYWIVFCYCLVGAGSAYVNRMRGREGAMVNIFRATRLWMWAGPDTLAEEAPHLGIAEVVALLSEVETTGNPSM